jgi:hypothetical protein
LFGLPTTIPWSISCFLLFWFFYFFLLSFVQMKPSDKPSSGDAFAARMKNEYSSNVDGRSALEEERVVTAQKAVLKQLMKLKGHMKKSGKRVASDGKLHISFGELFETVQGDMSTLSGIVWLFSCVWLCFKAR